MKPFNLESALVGKPVMCKDGRKVTQLTRIDLKSRSLLVGAIENSNNICTWDIDGEAVNHLSWEQPTSSDDLVMAVEKFEGWVNVYPSKYLYITGHEVYTSEKTAKLSATDGCVATVKIEWEE